jgi:phytepsin
MCRCSGIGCNVQGMGFPEIAVDKATPPFINMVEQGLIDEPVFSFWLDRNLDDPTGGELVLGGVDPAHYRGPHVWAPITRRGYWQFDVDHMSIAGRNSLCTHGCAAIADTGEATSDFV